MTNPNQPDFRAQVHLPTPLGGQTLQSIQIDDKTHATADTEQHLNEGLQLRPRIYDFLADCLLWLAVPTGITALLRQFLYQQWTTVTGVQVGVIIGLLVLVGYINWAVAQRPTLRNAIGFRMVLVLLGILLGVHP